MYNDKIKKAELIYFIGRLWFLFVFAGTVIDTLCISLTSVSLPLSNFVSWALFREVYQLSLYNGVPYLVGGALVSILLGGVYVLFFIFSGKNFGWMKAGFIVYACDSYFALSLFLNDLLIYGFVDVFHIIFDVIIFVLHVVGVLLLVFAVKSAGKIPRFEKKKKHRPNGAFSGQSFNTVRTLCLQRENNNIGTEIEYYYHINGIMLGKIAPGETKIIMIDGNYQRLRITANGSLPVESVVPAGRENTTYTLKGENLGSGGVSLIIERKS